jgi:hypothetical protein
MSNICQASAAILALSDADLRNLASAKKNKKLLERYIDVHLDCYLKLENSSDFDGHLEVAGWSGSSGLCGGCQFCSLVADGLQRESQHYRLYDHYQALLEPFKGEYPRTVGLKFMLKLKRLEYHRDPSNWNFGEKSEIMWDIHIVLIRGTVTLLSTLNMEIRPSSLDIEVAFEMFGAEDDPVSVALSLHRRPLASSALSETNVVKIKSWIEDCEISHVECVRPKHDVFLPTRLVDVGHPDCGDNLRLIQSSDTFKPGFKEVEQAHYMALSYCWGSSEQLLTTTHETLPTRLSLITFDSIPQALQDAVRVARILGIRYLWIDSLCIIQDDKADWQVESSRMSEIFSNAHLTVVAARGSSCTDSFLRRDHKLITCSVPFSLADEISGQFGLRYRRHWWSDKMAEIVDGGWITRGWTFQEERLARRVLLFGQNKFFFDCKTLERLEDTSRCKGRPDWVGTVRDESVDEKFGHPRRISSDSHLSNNRTSFDHWQTLCSHYSRRVLTFASDKLPAISGIAKQTAKRVHSDYLAGLWRAHLMHDLFWHTKHLSKRPDTYRAPSWSWASVDGHIAWSSWRWCATGQCEQFFQILEAHTVVSSLDPYGAVKDGYVKISGKMVEIDRPTTENMLPSSQGQTWYAIYEGQRFASARLDVALPDATNRGKLYALLAASCKVKKGQAPVPRGLILEKTQSTRDDGLTQFQRVGVFRVSLVNEDHLRAWRTSEDQTMIIV